MLSDFKAILWLKIRHARTGLVRLMYIVGTDVREDGDLLDRLYQLYSLAFIGVCLVLSWAALVNQVGIVSVTLDPAFAAFFAYAYLMLLLILFIVSALSNVREVPLKLSLPDIGCLVASSISPTALTITEACLQSASMLLVGGLGGYLLGVSLESFAPISFGAAALACFTALMLFTLSVWAWIVGILRYTAKQQVRRRIKVVSYGALSAATLLFSLVVVATPASGEFFSILAPQTFPYAILFVLMVLGLGIVVLGVRSQKLDMAAIIDANWLTVELNALQGLRYQDPERYAAIKQQKKLTRRGPRLSLPHREGTALLVSRAGLAHFRRYESLPGILIWCVSLIPAGAPLVLSAPDPTFMFIWLIAALGYSGKAKAATSVFKADVSNRSIRDHLPYSTLALLVFDSLPMLAVMLVITVPSSVAFCAMLGVDPVSIALTVLLVIGIVLSGGLSAVRPAFAKKPLSFEVALFTTLIPVCLLVFLDAPLFALVAEVGILALYVILIRSGQEL